MKKALIALVVIGILTAAGFYGYERLRGYVAAKVVDEVFAQVVHSDEVQEMLKDPEVLELLSHSAAVSHTDLEMTERTQTKNEDPQHDVSPSAKDESPKKTMPPMVVKNRDEAEALVEEKFSLGEIQSMAQKAKSGLSDEEKRRLKDEIKAKFTPEEWESLKILALMEAQKANP